MVFNMKDRVWQTFPISLLLFSRSTNAATVIFQDEWPDSGNIQVYPEIDTTQCYSTRSGGSHRVVNVAVINGQDPDNPSENGSGVLRAMALYTSANCGGDSALVVRWEDPLFGEMMFTQYVNLENVVPSLAAPYASWKPVDPGRRAWKKLLGGVPSKRKGFVLVGADRKEVSKDKGGRSIVRSSYSADYQEAVKEIKEIRGKAPGEIIWAENDQGKSASSDLGSVEFEDDLDEAVDATDTGRRNNVEDFEEQNRKLLKVEHREGVPASNIEFVPSHYMMQSQQRQTQQTSPRAQENRGRVGNRHDRSEETKHEWMDSTLRATNPTSQEARANIPLAQQQDPRSENMRNQNPNQSFNHDLLNTGQQGNFGLHIPTPLIKQEQPSVGFQIPNPYLQYMLDPMVLSANENYLNALRTQLMLNNLANTVYNFNPGFGGNPSRQNDVPLPTAFGLSDSEFIALLENEDLETLEAIRPMGSRLARNLSTQVVQEMTDEEYISYRLGMQPEIVANFNSVVNRKREQKKAEERQRVKAETNDQF